MLAYQFEGVPRRPLVVALKNILTLGIHTKVWLYRINREMDGHEGFHINFRNLGILLWVPLVTPIVAKFQTARRLDIMVSHQLNLPRIRPRTLGWISVIPVLGAGFYAYWVQHILNRHWFYHRREEHLLLLEEQLREDEQRLAELTGGDVPPLPEDVRLQPVSRIEVPPQPAAERSEEQSDGPDEDPAQQRQHGAHADDDAQAGDDTDDDAHADEDGGPTADMAARASAGSTEAGTTSPTSARGASV